MTNYRDINALNQSSLKKILESPKAYLDSIQQTDNSEQSHFVFGSVLDLMLTGTREEFYEKYVRLDESSFPTEKVKLIVDGVFRDADLIDEEVKSLDSYKDLILQHCNYDGYQSNWKDETRVEKIITQGSEYFELLSDIKGKTIISELDYSLAVNCKAAMASDKFTKPYVVKSEGVEFWDKFIVEFTWEGLNIKGELDRVVINHKEKTITPIDFKTTGKTVNSFNSDFWYYRYDFQAAVYKYGLTLNSSIVNYLDQGYKLENFLYIVVEKLLKNNPMIFEVPQKVIDIGFNGGVLSNQRELEGFVQAIFRYKFASENDTWEYPREYYIKGRLDIKI
jgi:hypothetical protein